MRKVSSRVTFLNRFERVTSKKIVIRDNFPGLTTKTTLEEKLGNLLGISSGTIIATEHHSSYGVRVLLEKLKGLGFIVQYGEGPLVCDYPKFHHASIIFRPDDDGEKDLQMSWGFTFLDVPPEVSLYKALFEAIERHATYYVEGSKTIDYPRVYKDDASFLYDLVPHFRTEQVNTFKVLASKKEDVSHVHGFKAKSLLTGKKRFLPLTCFYFGADVFKEERSILFEPTTSGSGAGTTEEMSLLAGIYEAIERDHFHLFWLANVTPKQILLAEESSFGAYVKRIQERYNLEVYFFDMRYDFKLKASYVIVIDPVLNIISCGAKVGQDPQKVVEGAFLEAIAVLDSIREVSKMADKDKMNLLLQGKSYLNEAISKLERIRMYCSQEGIKLLRKEMSLNSLTSLSFEEFAENAMTFRDQKSELAYMLTQFKEKKKEKGEGYDLYYHRHTSLYTKEIDCFVTHVFCPALIKLYLTETFSAPISERLTEFALVKGKHSFSEEDIRTLPHFFP